MTEVVLTNVSKRYAGTTKSAVHHLDLTFESGKLTALLGPSGCGKTTTMKMIAGILSPTQGDIQFDGQSMLKVPAERRGAAMVFQNNLLFPYMSVGDNVGFGLKMRGVKKSVIQQRVAEMLALVQLPDIESRHPQQLSGGQQQRVALARALIIEPKVLLLDEPLSSLDAYLRDEMRELIQQIQQQLHITTIFVTHDQEEAVLLADKIALMFRGVLQQVGTPNQFYDCPQTEEVARFFGGTNFIAGKVEGHICHTDIGKLMLPTSSTNAKQVTLTIRPESLVFTTNEEQENVVSGEVVGCIYAGTHARYKVAVGQYPLHVVTEPQTIHTYAVGNEVKLALPKERLWVLPPSKS